MAKRFKLSGDSPLFKEKSILVSQGAHLTKEIISATCRYLWVRTARDFPDTLKWEEQATWFASAKKPHRQNQLTGELVTHGPRWKRYVRRNIFVWALIASIIYQPVRHWFWPRFGHHSWVLLKWTWHEAMPFVYHQWLWLIPLMIVSVLTLMWATPRIARTLNDLPGYLRTLSTGGK